MITKTCETCGGTFGVLPYRSSEARFCSRRCVRQTPELERFWACVSPEPNTGCWLWTGHVMKPLPYGFFHRTGRGRGGAHRYSYELHVGPIAPGLHVLHRCDNPSCVNPDHLFVGTAADNIADMMAKGRNVPPRGARCGSAKLTAKQVLEVRRALAAGEVTRGEAAARLGVRPETIAKIERGERWGHLEHVSTVLGRALSDVAKKGA